ncbi:nuclease-related domain-containing protein [Flavobacterium daemonense]|uniref:nuclease-related domain-containing protein n=1 Tax=Flavobacterium daemonense TaxID=1393049 RepID=UPI0013A68244|nr:nuclease-related domain-containing protein [Flavobacterium daemonense]KAF2327304.1 NERD domain-containing protein [Flavobacterium daemonense]
MLVRYNVDEFRTLNELIHFRKNYQFNEEEIISDHTLFIQEEKSTLEQEIAELIEAIPRNKNDLEDRLRQQLDDYNQEIENLPETHSKIIPTIRDYWLNLVICSKFWFVQLECQFNIKTFNYQAKKLLSEKNKRFDYLSANFQDAVNESCFPALQAFEKKKEIIENLNNTIYGAVGEQKVENALRILSDDFILINDFCCTFKPPIYNKAKNDHIYSIQIDHLLISTSGIFLIETKNWSDNSLNNPDLRSPVEQILRTNFALYILLSDASKRRNGSFEHQNLIDRKIPIKNIIVFTNNKPAEEFQFVKMLTLPELVPYIKYFKSIFSAEETEIIAEYLLKFSEQKKLRSKLKC